MEGVDGSVMELTAIFLLKELPPPGNIMHIKMHVSKKTLGESFFGGWMGIWAHEQEQRRYF